MSNTGLIIFCISILLLMLLFFKMKLITIVSDKGITMRYIPFVKKETSWNEIIALKIVAYGFVGYGIRFGSKHGTVYNTDGNKGLAIVLKNGKKFLIGTQKPKELQQVINAFKAENI